MTVAEPVDIATSFLLRDLRHAKSDKIAKHGGQAPPWWMMYVVIHKNKVYPVLKKIAWRYCKATKTAAGQKQIQ
ncbi:hypothetical protein BJV78DRAFT_1197348 [Lactifluus subvellereus]|nr:hypothetical protein BJV78DRAFT_1197348 [Lactifluus subvellereus]